MSFLKKITSLFQPPPNVDEWTLWISVKCDRCGEIVNGRVDLRNDLSIEYGEKDSEVQYFTRKMLIGSGRCYNPIEVELTFDRDHKLIKEDVRGGKFVTDEE